MFVKAQNRRKAKKNLLKARQSNDGNLWWYCRVLGWEVNVKFKDTAGVRGVFWPGYHRLQQGRLLIVTGKV